MPIFRWFCVQPNWKWKSTFAIPSKAHKATEEKYFGKNQLMLNWFVVLLLTLLPLIALLAVILTSKDLPDIEQDDSTSFHEKKAKSTSSRVKTNVPSWDSIKKYLKSRIYSLTLRSSTCLFLTCSCLIVSLKIWIEKCACNYLLLIIIIISVNLCPLNLSPLNTTA